MESQQKLLRMTRRQFVASSLAAGAVTTPWASNGLVATIPVSEPAYPQGGHVPFRVIIDTDPGVDDALALLLAMRSPELKIDAITAVAGNVPLELTLPNALRMVEIAGRTDIPVAAGAKAPLVRRRTDRGRNLGLQSQRRRFTAARGDGDARGSDHADSRIGAHAWQNQNVSGLAR
jgi:hypothetical protein